MNFLDGHLFPENQPPLIITAAPYAPSWLPSDFPGEIAVTMEDQIQKAVDCYNAGATVLHLHVRELDGQPGRGLTSSGASRVSIQRRPLSTVAALFQTSALQAESWPPFANDVSIAL